jgi:signal transduction histidine kinase
MHVISKAKIVINTHQDQLRLNFIRASALAKRNNVLRKIADRARLNAAVMNEDYLASIGIDIHDGPVQLLSLITLKLPNKINRARIPPNEFAAIQGIRKEIEPLIHLIISDLRNICTGLVLPEVERLSTTETLNLAVTRHQNQTGTKVMQELGDLPEKLPRAFRVCAYRVIQEALNNAFKHAGGRNQRVLARQRDNMLEIAISNSGGVSKTSLPSKINDKQFGLRGMKSRIRALRGRLTIERLTDGGTEVRALLPLHK